MPSNTPAARLQTFIVGGVVTALGVLMFLGINLLLARVDGDLLGTIPTRRNYPMPAWAAIAFVSVIGLALCAQGIWMIWLAWRATRDARIESIEEER